ncbi:winged helix-turn-helix domain-containing protein [Bowmanella dokdonensis]|uniref:YcaQ family DNA glycosylase n=1 Tax=Bowmanella dokdonensis TaxID=751969 RepID=A0A939DSR2_9ALTE|nr:crosslink repair DNA glycosylase YcaQ family protein [Bowmanella dokdonensis]MBN7827256.1 YcaQ family DNA glycosylase [Bowmanella dokdonensis]
MNKIEIKHPKDQQRLRRLALAAQGLLQAQLFGRGLSGARKAIEHLGYVQIDTISVVERAHHHVFYNRVPGFAPDMLHRLLQRRGIFEYWSHAAAFLPMEDFRFSLPYKEAIKSGQIHWRKNPDTKLMGELLARIRAEGPLRSRDLDSGQSKGAGWWDWKPEKKALEQLYMQGDLMVSDRDGFQKTYDLTERVLPEGVDTSTPDMAEFAVHLVEQQLRCHGFATLKGLTYLRRIKGLRQAVKALVDERLSQGQLEQVSLGSELFILEAGALEQPLPRVNGRLQILSPFDNAVIQRERLKAIFGYDYQIECYVPGPKRRYGYFCLPLLYRDEFIGRMDCKAHRKTGRLEIKSVHFEPHRFDQDTLTAAFAEAVSQFCRFQQCDSVSLTLVQPGYLKEPLQSALR